MIKRYQVELDRNERDFSTFLKSRDISLSQREFRALIASNSLQEKIFLFDTKSFLRKIAGFKAPRFSASKGKLKSSLKI